MAVKRRVRSPAYNWALRVACGVAAGVAGFVLTGELYPVLNHGKRVLWAPIVSAVLVQAWVLLLIAPSLLGWWPDADAPNEIAWLSPQRRTVGIVAGIAAVAITAAFLAFVGESNPGL